MFARKGNSTCSYSQKPLQKEEMLSIMLRAINSRKSNKRKDENNPSTIRKLFVQLLQFLMTTLESCYDSRCLQQFEIITDKTDAHLDLHEMKASGKKRKQDAVNPVIGRKTKQRRKVASGHDPVGDRSKHGIQTSEWRTKPITQLEDVSISRKQIPYR
jgi:hypothetical protein